MTCVPAAETGTSTLTANFPPASGIACASTGPVAALVASYMLTVTGTPTLKPFPVRSTMLPGRPDVVDTVRVAMAVQAYATAPTPMRSAAIADSAPRDSTRRTEATRCPRLVDRSGAMILLGGSDGEYPPPNPTHGELLR